MEYPLLLVGDPGILASGVPDGSRKDMEERMDPVTFDDFKKLELRVGKVVSAEDHPNANKLYILKVDVGNGVVKQVVAGLKPYMGPDRLLGRQVVVVANMAPVLLRGMESQAMLLAASSGTDVVLVIPEKECVVGAEVR